MTVGEYVFTEEGYDLCETFCERFGGRIGFHEGDASVLLYISDFYKIEHEEYGIPEEESGEKLREVLTESLRAGINLIPQHYELLPYVDYGPDVDF